MIKFFRKIRQNLLVKNKTSQYFKYAIGEIVLVVIGILIALQINNWNEERNNRKEEFFILDKLQSDLETDIENLVFTNKYLEIDIKNYIVSLEILGRKREASKEEFLKNFGSILAIISFDQNNTTFNNLVSSGKLEIITNKELYNAIVTYYTDDYSSWDTALKDYTRNIIAPYLLKYDYIPQADKSNMAVLYKNFSLNFYQTDLDSFDIEAKTLEDYRKDIFIINILRQKLYNLQGQLLEYKNLLEQIKKLSAEIKTEKKRFKYD
jgi:hypothetical protein